MARCVPGCTCKKHSVTKKACPEGCTCKRHGDFSERGKKAAATMRGRSLSEEHRAALKCQPGCTCAKHELRNSGQYAIGSSGFQGTHSAETKAKLASYVGENASAYKHGLSKTRTYVTWHAMINRCYNPRDISYRYYGKRGIAVCDQWRTDFLNFLADMGERPQGRTLDRIDGEGNYEPENCRWATPREQALNRHRRTGH